jgi:hypothetical protein
MGYGAPPRWALHSCTFEGESCKGDENIVLFGEVQKRQSIGRVGSGR